MCHVSDVLSRLIKRGHQSVTVIVCVCVYYFKSSLANLKTNCMAFFLFPAYGILYNLMYTYCHLRQMDCVNTEHHTSCALSAEAAEAGGKIDWNVSKWNMFSCRTNYETKYCREKFLVLVKRPEYPLLEHRDEWTCRVAKTMTKTSTIVILQIYYPSLLI